VTETSNPCQQSRFILRTKKQEQTWAYALSEAIFAIVFIFNRAVSATVLIYNTWLTGISLHIKTCMTIVYGLGFFWIFIVLSMVAKKLKGKKTDALTEAFITSIDWLKKRNYLIWGVIAVWTLAVTLGARVMEWPYYHLTWKGFIIV
jgi:hypothetical protein